VRIAVVGVIGLVVLAAAAMQVIADGAIGQAGGRFSVPRLVAKTIGDRPSHALGLFPPNSTADVLTVRAQVDALDKAGDYRGAIALDRTLVARLDHDRLDQVALADALWRLGQLDAETGYVERGKRRAQWGAALGDYERALQLEPLSETMLLAAGNQALLNGDRPTALQYFQRAIAVDPGSADARAGLHRAQTGEGEPPPFVAPAEWKGRARNSP
jgi:tetratricopeptide (TPR) repeat protein